MAIFAVLSVLLFDIFLCGSGSWTSGAVQQDVENFARLGSEQMCRELYASAVGVIQPVAPFTDSAALSFQVPVGINALGNIIWGADDISDTGFRIRYRIENRRLMREVLDAGGQVIVGRSRVLASEAEGLSFSLATGSHILFFDFTTQESTPSGRVFTHTVNSRIFLRN